MRARELNTIIQLLRGFEHSYHVRFPQSTWEDAYHAGQELGRWIGGEMLHYRNQLTQNKYLLQQQTQLYDSLKIRNSTLEKMQREEKRQLQTEKDEIERIRFELDLELNQKIQKLKNTIDRNESTIHMQREEILSMRLEIEDMEAMTTKQHIELMRLRGDSSLT